MLPSPLTFPTPVVQVGAPQGWGRRDTLTGDLGGNNAGVGTGEKRKGSEIGGTGGGGGAGGGGEGSEAKKLKT